MIVTATTEILQDCYAANVSFSISRIANRMATLRRQLYNELGNTKLSQAMEAVGLDDEEEMWRRLDQLRVSAPKKPQRVGYLALNSVI